MALHACPGTLGVLPHQTFRLCRGPMVPLRRTLYQVRIPGIDSGGNLVDGDPLL
jgi:hypothetical protein